MNQESPPTSSVATAADRPTILSPELTRRGSAPADRTPPGQSLTRKWPVLHYGEVPEIDISTWSLRIWGLCENPLTLDWKAFNALPKVDLKCDIHCVTHWSRLDAPFTGVAVRTILELVKPLPEAQFVMQHGASAPGNDWTTNLPINAFDDDDCILATHFEGEPLTAAHGYPVHCIVPKLYFWKGAKWMSGIEFLAHDAPGFWEVNGYHMHGDPWKEERFGW